ncbi:MAG: SAM-dependent methyltransferase [Candidatus Marinimicrobia bacterium]|nr:SAM-dependent methyltransferase [Candidatus Neomarinimicrobiota bacterium]MEC7935791.1 class I SAM-dependent methyltransferase [Candidatus Neomarinimicrobiota bacterium]|tara:strand:- start:2996 stop:3658 length:663 start_codon:yes stop_codon:yes gene_type:complete
MSNQTISITDSIYKYLCENSLREDEVLSSLRAYTYRMQQRNMQISPEQGQFMQLLIKLMGAKNTIEIGVFTGYSSLCVALALPLDGKIIACDISTKYTDIAEKYWKDANVRDKIDLRIGPALDTLQKLIDKGLSNTFDFSFIDADKINYDNYYELSLKLLRPGGLIAIDNVLWSGDVVDERINDIDTESIRSLNKKIYIDKRVDISILPIGDGLTLALKK